MMLSRRAVGAGLGSAAATGCAGRGGAPVVVALAPSPTPDDAAQLATGLDPALRMTAPVYIDGKGPFDFAVDTGANRTVVSVELARQLGLPDAGPANVHGVAGVEPAATATVREFQVDAVTLRKIRVPTLLRARLGVDGLIGVDVMRNRRVLLNFVRNQLTIGPSAGARGDGTSFDARRAATAGAREDLGPRVVVPARYRFGQLVIIGADVARRPVTAFIDSGSQSTVGNNALRRLVMASAAVPTPLRMSVPVFSVTGQTAEGELRAMPLLRIGGLDITGLTAAFADLHVFRIWELMDRPSLLIGMDVMRQFNAIELNYPARQVAFHLKQTRRRA